ncbi:MAG: 50S ribosomal protein L5 [SAR324 cluster bacterium]|nr:50S ribosomal protein L5 [SAR324 cluster bacterium]MEC8358691.1 50S ribosomal protein L5 [SAR324 cluster bacterium]
MNLQQLYFETVSPQLEEEFSVQNVHLIPKISKVTVNVGLGEAVQNPKSIDQATEQLAQIVGQKPVVTRARKSIAGFKLREGMQIGCMVTLRRERMWSFLDRLVQIALPRVKDFRGISPKGFDGKGNYNLGIKEQLIFPEIDFDQIDRIRGMNVSIVTTAQNDQLALSLLKGLGFPFRK